MQPATRLFLCLLSSVAIIVCVTGYFLLLKIHQLSPESSYLFMPAGLTSAALAALYLALYLRGSIGQHNRVREQQLLDDLISKAQDLIQVLDTKGNILYVNDSWVATLGYSRSEAARLNIFEIISDDCKNSCKTRFNDLVKGLGKGCFEVTYITRDNQAITLEGNCFCSIKNGKPHLIRGIFRDISARREQDKRIMEMAYFDMLTGLPNRYLLNDRLSQALHQARRYHQNTALVYVDLDKFKNINDHHGHAIGDFLLQKVSRRMRDCLRENDTIARLGGDEFLLILTGIKSREDIPHIVDKVRISLAAPYTINSLRLNISASLGTAIYPTDGVDTEALLNQADAAMFQAKLQGGNRHCFYNELGNKKAKVLRLA